MPSYTQTWDESVPAGSRALSLGDDDIRAFKSAIRERLATDHHFASDETGDSDIGYHDQVTFVEAANIGTGADGRPILGAQITESKAELVFTDEDDNDIQITRQGYVHLDSGIISNDTYLTAYDNAGTGTVDLIKANTSDAAQLPDASTLATSAAPTDDAHIANKKYVDDSVSALSVGNASFLATPVSLLAYSEATRDSGNNVDWTDVDVTANVGTDTGNVSGVMLMVNMQGNAQAGEAVDLWFRKNGTSLTSYIPRMHIGNSSATDTGMRSAMLLVPIDTGDVFEYKWSFTGSVGITSLAVDLIGYFTTV